MQNKTYHETIHYGWALYIMLFLIHFDVWNGMIMYCYIDFIYCKWRRYGLPGNGRTDNNGRCHAGTHAWARARKCNKVYTCSKVLWMRRRARYKSGRDQVGRNTPTKPPPIHIMSKRSQLVKRKEKCSAKGKKYYKAQHTYRKEKWVPEKVRHRENGTKIYK